MSHDSSSSKNQKRITHKDIAEVVGVSQSTVSMAMRNHPRITEAVRIKIQEKALELGYSPDPMLSALSQYRLSKQENPAPVTLAWINLHRDPQVVHEHQEFVLYFEGAEAYAKKLGYKLEEFQIAKIRPARLNTILKTRNIRGILLSPPDIFFDPNWDDFPWQDYVTVRFGRSASFPAVHFVSSAQSTNATLAFDAIRERGYQRIGMITDYRRRRVFGAGFLWAQYELPEDERVPLLSIDREFATDEKLSVLRKWMDSYRPDAILSDIKKLPELLGELGYRVPEDVALATTSILDTPIDAGIDQRPKVIGEAGVRTLTALIHAQNFGIPSDSNEILVTGQWKDGSMLPDRRKGK